MDEYAGFPVVTGGRPAQSWGDYRLGDLADALQSTVRVLGQSARVSWLALYPPTDGEPLPVVQLALATQRDLEAARVMLDDAGYLSVEDVDEAAPHSFEAATDSVVVHVWVKD